MGLPFGGQQGPTEGFMGDGIFIDEAEVVSIEDISGQTTERQRWARDLAMEVTMKLLKNDWERSVTIAGDFEKDKQTGAIIGWGAAFKVRNFFDALGVGGENVELTEDNKLPELLLAAATGRQALILSYSNKRGKTSTWNQVAAANASKEDFKDYFLTGFNKSGYPKNYDPNARGSGQASQKDLEGPWDEGQETPEERL